MKSINLRVPTILILAFFAAVFIWSANPQTGYESEYEDCFITIVNNTQSPID